MTSDDDDVREAEYWRVSDTRDSYNIAHARSGEPAAEMANTLILEGHPPALATYAVLVGVPPLITTRLWTSNKWRDAERCVRSVLARQIQRTRGHLRLAEQRHEGEYQS